VAPGTLAPALLCKDRKKRPLAEALLAGRPVRATIPLPGDDERQVNVRSIRTDAPGWLLLLEDGGRVGDDVVEFHGMWTCDPAMKQLFRMITRVAADDVTVLIRGESGSGKELVAHALHELSDRRKGPFQAVNCAALSPTLLEAELFGALRGAFTGSHRDTPGLIRSAHKGTLFLDEVAELPLELQAKLLRVLETRVVLPVGGHEPVAVDVRVLSATHQALRREVEAGRFRADLMYRLRVIPLFLPPLRERRHDVPIIAQRLLDELNAKSRRRRVESIAPAALAALAAWSWPGNVRELKNALQYALAMGDGPVLTPAELPPEILDREPGATTPTPTTTASTRGRVEQALAEAHGNRDDAARALGVSRVTLWRWMKEAGVAVRRRRAPAEAQH
jgi:transcriptional regulator with PAS, ATPase and Fis domain